MTLNKNLRRNLKIAFVTFARSKDTELLALAEKTWQAHSAPYKKSWTRHIVDEPSDRIPDSEFPKYATHWTVEFPRGNTLDGLECVVGMVSCFKTIAADTGADYIMKWDADTLMLDTKFVGPLSTKQFVHYGHAVDLKARDEAGNVLGKILYCQGPAYAISRGAVESLPEGEALREHLKEVDLDNGGLLSVGRKSGYSWPEDESNSQLVWSLYKRPELFGWEPKDIRFGHLAFWDYKRYRDSFSKTAFKKLQAFDFVDFGKTSPIASKIYPTWASRREVVKANMGAAVDLLSHTETLPGEE